MEKTILPLRSFDGGLNQKENPALIEDNEFPIFDDLDYTLQGLGGQRDGERRFTDRVNDGAVEGLFIYNPAGSAREVIIVANGEIWKSTDGGTLDGSSLATPFSAGNQVEAVELNDLLFLVESGTEMKKYDGSSVTKAGIDAPESADQTDSDDGAPNVATGSAGNLNGDYKYRITYESDTSESDPGAESATVSPSNEQVDLSDIPVSPASEVNDRGIYRTQANGEVFYKVGTVGDNSATTFTDDTKDVDLGAQLDTDSGVPPSGLTIIEKFHDFLFGAGDSSNEDRLYYSQQLEPEKWDALNFIDIQFGEDIPITALQAWRDQLYIFKTEGIGTLTGFSENEFQVNELFERFGAPTPRAVTASMRELYFYDGDQSVYRLSGANINRISLNIEPELESVNNADDVALAIDQESKLHLSYEDANGRGRELIWDPFRESWLRFRGRNISRYALRVDDTLLSGSRDEGLIRELGVTNTGDQIQFIHQNTGTSQTLDNRYTARRFTTSRGGVVNEVHARLKKNSGASRKIRALLYNDDSGDPGSSLETSDNNIDESNLTTSFEWKKFDFNTVELDEGTNYHVVLQISDEVEFESSVDVDGQAVLSQANYVETVDLTKDTAKEITHNLSQQEVVVQFYDNNNQQAQSILNTVEITGADTVELTSGVDVNGTVVISRVSNFKSVNLSKDSPQTLTHDIGSKYVIAQFYDSNNELQTLQRVKAVDSNNIEVESGVDVSGTVMLLDNTTSSALSLTADTASSLNEFSNEIFVFAQFYDNNDELASLQRIELLEPSDGDHSEWQGESGSFSEDDVNTSSDAESWTEDTSLTLNLRIYTDSIPWVLETKEYDLEQPHRRKQFRRVTTHLRATSGDVTFTFFGDGMETDSKVVTLPSGGSTLGSFELGTDVLGGQIEQIEEFSVNPSNLGRRVSLRIESVNSVDFELLSLNPKLHVRNPK